MLQPSSELDLSYLTPDERRVIEDVIRRQHEEEERNNLILRYVVLTLENVLFG